MGWSTAPHQQRLSSPRRRGSSTPRLLGFIAGVSGILDRPVKQPVLAPGERFEYTSYVPLPTTSGFMTGRYRMVTGTGQRFEIEVPTFSLDSPDGKRVLN
jgi:hypothetical protein